MTLDKKLEILVRSSKKSIPCILNNWNATMDKPYTLYSGCGAKGVYARIDRLIKNSSVAECLSSPYLYVRKAKTYFERTEHVSG